MKTIIIVLSTLLSLGACSGNIKDDSPKPGNIKSAPSKTGDKDEQEQFTTIVMEEFPYLDSSTLPELGDTICDSLSALSVNQMVDIGAETGYSAYEMGFLIGSAVGIICPEYGDKLTDNSL